MTSTELVSTPLDKEGNLRRRLGRLIALAMVALIGVGCSNAPAETGGGSSSSSSDNDTAASSGGNTAAAPREEQNQHQRQEHRDRQSYTDT